MTAQRDMPWVMFDWPAKTGTPPHHLSLEDLRRWIWVVTHGLYARGAATIFEPQTEQNPYRFAPAWQSVMLPYPEENIVYEDEQQRNANCRYPYFAPGDWVVYYHGSFTHDFVRTTQTEFVFNLTQKTAYSIWNQNCDNGYTIYVAQDQETWYEEQDDFRKGTPFVVTGSVAANRRFFRVRNAEIRDDNGVNRLFVSVDNNDYEQQELEPSNTSGTATCDFGGDWYVLRSSNGHVPFPGVDNQYKDMYETNLLLQSEPDFVYQGQAPGKWWSAKDQYHRYAGNIRGPNDGRPPDGGQQSVDFNKDWIRCANPNLYHTYDKNAHRWFVKTDWSGSALLGYADLVCDVQVYQGHLLLPTQADPKEQVSPFWFFDTHRAHWKYGAKVKVAATQLTHPATLGAKAACVGDAEDRGQGMSPRFVGISTDDQYPKSSLSVAYQNAIEAACSYYDWVWPTDLDYATNWIWMNWDNTVPQPHQQVVFGDYDSSRTYGSVYTSNGLSYAWRPEINETQPQVASMKDELWGENGSAFELALKLCGEYDWYYDDDTPYMPKRVNDQKWVWWLRESTLYPGYPPPQTWNGVYCTTYEQIREAAWPKPKGTWRRTWKYSLGRPHGKRMRDSSRGEPCSPRRWVYDNPECSTRFISRCVLWNETVADDAFHTFTESGTKTGNRTFTVSGDKRTRLSCGAQLQIKGDGDAQQLNVVKSEYNTGTGLTTITVNGDINSNTTSLAIKGDDNIIKRHDPHGIINQSALWVKGIPSIVNNCRKVLEQLKYTKASMPIGVVFKTFSGSHDPRINQNYDYLEGNGSPDWDMISNRIKFQINLARELDSLTPVWDYDQQYYNTIHISCNYYVYHYPFGTIYPTRSEWWWSSINMQYSKGAFFVNKTDYNADMFIDPNEEGRKLGMLISVYSQIPNPPTGYRYPKFKNLINVEITKDYVRYYQFIILDLQKAVKHTQQNWYGETTKYYFPFELSHPLFGWMDKINEYQSTTQYGETYNLVSYQGYASATIEFAAQNNAFVVVFDFSRYSDAIWVRTRERADWRLIDPFGRYDTRPPIDKNRWIITPEVYDAMYEESGDYNNTYASPDYAIRAEANLMEDVEGNGVEYIFDFVHGTSSAVNNFDRTQTSRKYNVAIGDNTDAWTLYDDYVAEWQIILNSKDKYSGNVPTRQDNIGIPLDPVPLRLCDELPMFPVKPRIETEKILVNGVWYDHVWTDAPWVDTTKSPLKYRLELFNTFTGQWVTLYDFGDTNPPPPSGGNDGDNHFYLSGQIYSSGGNTFTVTQTSNFTYRLRYQNSVNASGQYSNPKDVL